MYVHVDRLAKYAVARSDRKSKEENSQTYFLKIIAFIDRSFFSLLRLYIIVIAE
jgi:hypothetical protein